MIIPATAFTNIDWDTEPAERHDGEQGFATWRTRNFGNLRVRRVDYSPGYLADHWCDRGHVLHLLSGAIRTELKDGRSFDLAAGQSYVVSDFGDSAHRTYSAAGASLFIVD